jgi:hypothetical protein
MLNAVNMIYRQPVIHERPYQMLTNGPAVVVLKICADQRSGQET